LKSQQWFLIYIYICIYIYVCTQVGAILIYIRIWVMSWKINNDFRYICIYILHTSRRHRYYKYRDLRKSWKIKNDFWHIYIYICCIQVGAILVINIATWVTSCKVNNDFWYIYIYVYMLCTQVGAILILDIGTWVTN